MSIKVITTDDGSHSLYNSELKETYHSSHGAITESQHVFVKHGIHFYYEENHPDQIKIFEVGFGTGLNALLSWHWADQNKVDVVYHSIEQYPIQEEIIKEINYGKLKGEQDKFILLHATKWEEEKRLSSFFTIKKVNAIWQEYLLNEPYNVVYYDAFAPSKQPEMWDRSLLEKCYKALTPKGIFTTYCAKGQLKRDLVSIGFEVETLPGPPGKKEMVRGVKVQSF